jgi:N-methylhydantoinase A
MTWRMGIDIGGTFTDFALVDDARGQAFLEKVLTTPQDPSVAVLEGVRLLLSKAGIGSPDLTSIIHGSTLVTNAVIERKGARTGMLVTKGFADVLEIALERRYDLYDLRLRFPAPIVDRTCRVEIDERMREDGTSQKAPDLEAVERGVRKLLQEHKVRAVAVCFLHSFTNPEHEEMVARFIRGRFPQLYVSTSAEVLPFIREYERWTTTTVNAFVQPIVDTYLSRLETGLAGLGFRGKFYVMTSSGGTVTADVARRYPVRMLESGPAAGVFMAAHHAKYLGIDNVLSFDMGGTTAKGAIVRNSEVHQKYELEVARVHEYKTGSGLPVRVPVVNMIEIGAGGGGIAELDDRGVIRVGPRSAGAEPGPACYRRGGTAPTLTDANLALGFFDAGSFLGGAMQLDESAGRDVIDAAISKPLEVETSRAAWGIHETINEDVARAFRVHASDIGFDYRNSSMVAFGGCGPAHAARIARKLRIPQVVFPAGSGVMSAIGMLVSPISYQLARTKRVQLRGLTQAEFTAFFEELQADAAQVLQEAGIPAAEVVVQRQLDMRYAGQGYEIEVALPRESRLAESFAQLEALFGQAYQRVFSLGHLDEPIEILNWKIQVRGPEPRFDDGWSIRGAQSGTAAKKGSRRAYFPEAGGYVECAVYDRYGLMPGATVEGPALVEERESTCVLGVGDRARIDQFGNMIAEIGSQ